MVQPSQLRDERGMVKFAPNYSSTLWRKQRGSTARRTISYLTA
jgi:hypothetical protein